MPTLKSQSKHRRTLGDATHRVCYRDWKYRSYFKSVSQLLGVCALTIAPAAAAQSSPAAFEVPVFSGKTNVMDFTGANDPREQEVQLSPRAGQIDGKPVGLGKILIYEKGDEPCYIVARYYGLNRDDQIVANRSYVSPDGGCENIDQASKIEVDAYSRTPSGENHSHFLSTIGTTTNSKNNDRGLLVKGLTGAITAIDHKGKNVTTGAILNADMQPNGKHQNFTYSICPDRQIAIGLDAHVMPIGGKMSITGLRLRCKAVTSGFGTVNPQAVPHGRQR